MALTHRITLLGAGTCVAVLLASCSTARTSPASSARTSLSSTAGPTGADSSTSVASDAGSTFAGTPPPTGRRAPVGTPRTVTAGLAAPWSVVFHGDTPLVSERDSARILELAADGAARPIGTIPGVAAAGEGGLLGLAVDEQSRLYAYFTADDGNRIARFDISGEPGSLTLGPPETILDQIPSASYHDGGRLAFGPDQMLYATVGDAGQSDRAQDLDSLSGKILRMTPDGEVPQGNPYPGSLVYSYGHRNPQGLTWTDDGTMFATEFGQNTWDELNIITPGSNYGWPTVEGIAGTDGFTDPVQQWAPQDASPSGMTSIGGTLFIANLRGAVLRAVPAADPTTSTDYFSGEFGRIRDVTVAPDGRLWFVTNNTDGRGTPRPGDDQILSVDVE
ncbi:PQQ-dependent sugar dehydrogenase [Nakamurella sp. A5-74]|uniref:PQQ-dependent sugar dehydrogenase n=1 Tax=Nakamurella sp. A5-74 TaxID=3158264 RepID=A0AAU8DPJ1_9ACTN